MGNTESPDRNRGNKMLESETAYNRVDESRRKGNGGRKLPGNKEMGESDREEGAMVGNGIEEMLLGFGVC